MVAAGTYQLERHECGNPFAAIDPEDVEDCFAWEAGGVLNRSMIDRLDRKNRIIWDLKTTGLSANPEDLDRIVASRGYDVQAAQYLEGVEDSLDRMKFRFVFQEKFYPFLLSVVELSDEWIDTGRRKLRRAREIWRSCLDSGNWPGYPAVVCQLDQPAFSEGRWFEREIREDGIRQKTGRDVLELAMRWQAPTL